MEMEKKFKQIRNSSKIGGDGREAERLLSICLGLIAQSKDIHIVVILPCVSPTLLSYRYCIVWYSNGVFFRLDARVQEKKREKLSSLQTSHVETFAWLSSPVLLISLLNPRTYQAPNGEIKEPRRLNRGQIVYV